MNKTEDSVDTKNILTNKVIQYATKEFTTKGIKAVKMDDIAKGLVISKRTLYEIFDNKEQLLLACVIDKDKKMQKHFEQFAAQKTSTIAIVVEFYRYQLQSLNGMNANFPLELSKYPTVQKWLEERHRENNEKAVKFFKDGVKEGYFRKDVNYNLIEHVCSGAIDYTLRQGLLKRFSLKEVFKDAMMLYIRGFCTLKGIEVLEKLL